MHEGFILSSAMGDAGRRSGGDGLVFRGRLADGRRFRWQVTRPRLCFFIEHATAITGADAALRALRKTLELRTLRGAPVDALYFASVPDLARARRQCEALGVATYEADVPAAARHLMERGVKGSVRFLDEPVREEGGVLHFLDARVEGSDFTPRLRLLSFDVECAPDGRLFAIALHGDAPAGTVSRAWVVDPEAARTGGKPAGYLACADERGLLAAFFAAVRACDPDCLIGWNVVNFDLRYLAEKCAGLGLDLDLGVDAPAEVIDPDARGISAGRAGPQWLARVPGRAVLDGIAMLRAAFVDVESYGLGAVAHEILGKHKLIELEGRDKVREIERQFREDKEALARYNLVDAQLAYEIFAKLSLSQLAVRKAQLTGLAVDRMGGSIAAFDFLYLPRLHRRGFVAETQGQAPVDEGVPGGLVLESVPGFHRRVLVLDFKSLYPSIIRTFLIDPLAAAAAELWAASEPAARGPAGPAFARDWALLPGIVAELMEARERAKKDRDASLSQAVKIIMNSLYGVLGNATCRFYHPDLAGTITRCGQWVLLETKRFLEARGFPVLYGDTDSLFVHAESAVAAAGDGDDVAAVAALRRLGAELCADLNRHMQVTLADRFGVESRLSLEFEKIFLGFFMPALRHEERGSKKRYAGLLVKESRAAPSAGGANAAASEASQNADPPVELYFAGLESARSDWTALAKEFQGEILSLAFTLKRDGDREPLERLVRDWNRRLFAGELDDKLEYRKGLSKNPEQYSGNAPPHVRAARALDERNGREARGRVIRYVMTVEGPEPIQLRSGARPDYRHYAEKQLAPVADMVLRFFGTDFRAVTGEGEQLRML